MGPIWLCGEFRPSFPCFKSQLKHLMANSFSCSLCCCFIFSFFFGTTYPYLVTANRGWRLYLGYSSTFGDFGPISTSSRRPPHNPKNNNHCFSREPCNDGVMFGCCVKCRLLHVTFIKPPSYCSCRGVSSHFSKHMNIHNFFTLDLYIWIFCCWVFFPTP